MGRKPKPPAPPVKPDRERPIPPAHLYPEELAEFTRVVDALETLGTLASQDGDAIALYAELYGRRLRAKVTLHDAGEYYLHPNGSEVLHPANKVYDECGKQMKVLLLELGLTPASRKKVTALKPTGDGEMWRGLV